MSPVVKELNQSRPVTASVKVLGVHYDNLRMTEALDHIRYLLSNESRSNVFFLNLDCVRQAQHDEEYLWILRTTDLVLPDGVGVKLLTRMAGEHMRENCNGTDLGPLIMEECSRQGLSVYFLGGKPGVAAEAAEKIRQRIPKLTVAGAHDGYFQDDERMIDEINNSGADVLFVAMGVPLQEKWIARHRARLRPRLCLGVGALLDYLSGRINRAPKWMVRGHIEWLYRVFIEPQRMVKRYLIDGFGFLFSVPFLMFKSKMHSH